MGFTDHQAKYYAHELTIQHAADGVDRLSQSLFDASVDLNPHQIGAALFAINNPLNQGVVLADEVGLGKTIEAALVLSQYWAERKRKLLIICPASLRRQWAQELIDKFNLPSQILDAKTWRTLSQSGASHPLSGNIITIMSYHYAARIEEQLLVEAWDLVVIDEAHKLRNAHRPNNKMGQALKRALAGRKKLLLTATPMQNSLMELYGLSTMIDEHLFGDEFSFRQQYVNNPNSNYHLKNRLKGFLHRTLRKDVLEYVKYTQRQALTVPFTPTTQEQHLYNGISALLEREESYALPKRQRHLTGLILRKLLASSSHAVLNTLETIKRRLETLLQGTTPDDDLISQIIEDDDLEQDYLEELVEQPATDTGEEIDKVRLLQEIEELAGYIELAKAIQTDSKATALLTALSQGFERMAAMNAPRKVIIFTESKRTQDYLAAFLAANGHQDKVVTFSGSNNHPEATRIYHEWLTKNLDTDNVSGSPQVDRRTALIDNFRNEAEIMIATEAAAEGVNLQFCSLLINYDLPWNPQRVEQRIGRCHRYGQKFDVVVINFLNNNNLADQRVLELLTEKFHLFDGVFGASDEVLGSIESGVNFEKRIQSIYETCRMPAQIEEAFSQLRQELESDINQKMQQTRQLLLDNFDEDIHDLLKLQLDAAEQRLDKVGRWFWALTKHELAGKAAFNNDNHSFNLAAPIASSPAGVYQLIRHNSDPPLEIAHVYRLTHKIGDWVLSAAKSRSLDLAAIEFNYSTHNAKISVIENLSVKSGWLSLEKYTIESLERNEEYLLFSAMDANGNNVPSEIVKKIMPLPAKIISSDLMLPNSVDGLLLSQLEVERNSVEKAVNTRNLSFFEQEVNKLDSWADDIKEGLEQAIKELDKGIKQVRRDAKIAVSLEEKLSLQKLQRKLESERNVSRKELFDKQDEIDVRRESLIQNLEKKLNKRTTTEKIFTIRWSIV